MSLLPLLSGPSSLLRSGGGQSNDDDYDDMDTESSDQGYTSQPSVQPSDATAESQSAQQQHVEPQQEPITMNIPVPSAENSLSSDAVSVTSQSTTPTELPGTLDSGLGSDYELMSESSSQSQPALELPLQHGATSVHSSSSPSPVQGSPAVATLPISSEVSGSLQFGPSMSTVATSTTAIHLPTTSSQASGTSQLGVPMSTQAIPSAAGPSTSIPPISEFGGTLQVGLSTSAVAMPTTLSTASPKPSDTLQVGLPVSTAATCVPLPTASSEASVMLHFGSSVSTTASLPTTLSTTAMPIPTASPELNGTLQPELPVSTAAMSIDSGYSTTTALESGSIPVAPVMSHSENLVPNPPLPSVPTSQLPEGEPPTSKPQLEASAIPALIPEDMSLEDLHKKVKEHFPAFKPYGILRFLSLLGPGNTSSLPNRWKGAKKPKRGRKKEGEKGITADWQLDIDFVPPPEMCMSDDEVS